MAGRHACPGWLSHRSQLDGAGELLVQCGDRTPPCVAPAFFHATRQGAHDLSMPHPFMWNHAPPCSRADLYTQCRKRHRDDWVNDLHQARERSSSRTVEDVLALLGGRTVTVVGSSMELQLELAVQCAIAEADRCNQSDAWRHWGWGTFHDDNLGCQKVKTVADVLSSGCAAHGQAFEAMLANTDVVIVSYNAQYCFRHSPALWSSDLRALLPILERFARRAGKIAMMREPSAQHFPDGGSYNASRHASRDVNEPCTCQPAADDDPRDLNRIATFELRQLTAELAPSVSVLPFYDATKPRHKMHLQAMCAYRPPRSYGAGPPSPPAVRSTRAAADGGGEETPRPTRACCDCTHFCHSPAFYEATFFTPLYHVLEKAGPRSAKVGGS